MEGTRVVFTFDERSLAVLKQMTEESHFPSMAATVRAALRIVNTLQTQAKNGYTEVIVRNPTTGAERMIVIDFLESLSSTPA